MGFIWKMGRGFMANGPRRQPFGNSPLMRSPITWGLLVDARLADWKLMRGPSKPKEKPCICMRTGNAQTSSNDRFRCLQHN